MLDRFDIHITLPPVRVSALRGAARGESTETVARRVEAARERRRLRAGCDPALFRLSGRPAIEGLLRNVSNEAITLLHRSIDKLGLSLRAYHKVLAVSRTIADLAGKDEVGPAQVAEAIQYRVLDRDEQMERRFVSESAPARAPARGENRVI
jgi:magnesium chelatase family protein